MFDRLRNRLDAGRQDGFTLIELLIVIVILGILAGIVVFAVGNSRTEATTASCTATKKTVSVAAEAHKARTGGYPTFAELTPQLKDTSGLVAANYTQSSGTYTC